MEDRTIKNLTVQLNSAPGINEDWVIDMSPEAVAERQKRQEQRKLDRLNAPCVREEFGRSICDCKECDKYVDCDDDCLALEDPKTAEEIKLAYEHWADHGSLSGCSHGR